MLFKYQSILIGISHYVQFKQNWCFAFLKCCPLFCFILFFIPIYQTFTSRTFYIRLISVRNFCEYQANCMIVLRYIVQFLECNGFSLEIKLIPSLRIKHTCRNMDFINISGFNCLACCFVIKTLCKIQGVPV